MNGKLVVFEGIDGSGKTTMAEWLSTALNEAGYPSFVFREPGGTEIGESIRTILKTKSDTLCKDAELLLFLASRAQLIHERIIPSLKNGEIVILDRFRDSTIAYQGFGNGLNLEILTLLNNMVSNDVTESLVLFLDVELNVAKARKTSKLDKYDEMDERFSKRVRRGYMEIMKQNPMLYAYVNANRTEDEVKSQIQASIYNRLGLLL